MTTQARIEARRNLDHVNRLTDEDGPAIDDPATATVIAITGVGYALLDVADAIRKATR